MRLLALIVSTSMMATACGGDDDSSAPVLTLGTEPATTAEPATTEAPTTTSTTAPSTTETTIDQEAQDRAEIEDVVQRFHAYYYEVGLIEGLPGLDELATSPIYDRSLITVNDFVSRGYTAGEGDQGHRTIEIRFPTPGTAEVEGCLLDGGQIVVIASQHLVQQTRPTLVAGC